MGESCEARSPAIALPGRSARFAARPPPPARPRSDLGSTVPRDPTLVRRPLIVAPSTDSRADQRSGNVSMAFEGDRGLFLRWRPGGWALLHRRCRLILRGPPLHHPEHPQQHHPNADPDQICAQAIAEAAPRTTTLRMTLGTTTLRVVFCIYHGASGDSHRSARFDRCVHVLTPSPRPSDQTRRSAGASPPHEDRSRRPRSPSREPDRPSPGICPAIQESPAGVSPDHRPKAPPQG